MVRARTLELFTLAIVASLTSASAWSDARFFNLGSKHAIPGEYIVLFKSKTLLASTPGAAPAIEDTIEPTVQPDSDARARELGGAIATSLAAHLVKVWSVGTQEGLYIRGTTDSGVRSLAHDSRIASIEANVRTFEQTTQTTSTYPNYVFPTQLDRIDQRALPLDGSYTYATTASNVMVVVVDSGIDAYGDGGYGLNGSGTSMGWGNRWAPHEFGNRIVDVHDCVVSTDCSYQAYPLPYGYSSLASPPWGDCSGHSTDVADLAAGAYAGVAKGVMLSSVIVGFSCNGSDTNSPGTVYELQAGINYYIGRKEQQPNTPYVMIIPISPEAISPVVDAAVKAALAANITVVVSAGDIDGDVCGWSPADLSKTTAVISVSATYSNTVWGPIDERIPGNATGSCVTLFAPGDGYDFRYPYPTGNPESWEFGTSFSAPIVGGIAALYLSTTPTAPPSEVKAAIVYAATSGKLPTSGSGAIGVGSPNLLAYSLVPAGAPPGYVPPPPPGLSSKAKAAVSAVITWLLNACGTTC